MDIQRDEAIYQVDAGGLTETEIEKPEDDIIVVTSELVEPNLLDIIKARIDELEEANKQLNKELAKTQAQLTLKTEEAKSKVSEVKRKKVAEVKLEPVAAKEDVGFWQVVCGIAKSFVRGFLNFFGIHY